MSNINKELENICSHSPQGTVIVLDKRNHKMIHVLLIGPSGTPYENGFFYFIMDCSKDYPDKPPSVKFMTPAGKRVKFHPNLLSDGTVCLPVLKTSGLFGWNPRIGVRGVLASLRALFYEDPFFAKPGMKFKKDISDSEDYNDIISHETIRVAVCDMLDIKKPNSKGLPQSLRQYMKHYFLNHYYSYHHFVLDKLHLTKEVMRDPYGHLRGMYNYKNIMLRLQELKKELGHSNLDRHFDYYYVN